MSTHNKRFYGEILKITLELSINSFLICSFVLRDRTSAFRLMMPVICQASRKVNVLTN